MSTLDILKTARGIIARDGFWTRGAMAKKGSFCALGAVAAADGKYAFTYDANGKRVAVSTDPAFPVGASIPAEGSLSPEAEKAIRALSASLKLNLSAYPHRPSKGGQFTTWTARVSKINDDRSKDKDYVLKMYDRAIARVERSSRLYV